MRGNYAAWCPVCGREATILDRPATAEASFDHAVGFYCGREDCFAGPFYVGLKAEPDGTRPDHRATATSMRQISDLSGEDAAVLEDAEAVASPPEWPPRPQPRRRWRLFGR
jgi:hypothetical protein